MDISPNTLSYLTESLHLPLRHDGARGVVGVVKEDELSMAVDFFL
jgi:hypothetical protein